MLKKKISAEQKRWYVSAHGPQCAVVLLVLITPNTHTHLVDCSEGPIRRAGQVTGQEKSVLKSVVIQTIPRRDGVLQRTLQYISHKLPFCIELTLLPPQHCFKWNNLNIGVFLYLLYMYCYSNITSAQHSGILLFVSVARTIVDSVNQVDQTC